MLAVCLLWVGWVVSIDYQSFISPLLLPLLSGPIDLIMSSESGLTALRLTGPTRTELTRPFSAASRDPGKHRFSTMKDYFAHSSQPQYPTALCVRVVGKDLRTGKQALLYQSHKNTQRSVKVSTLAYWQQYVFSSVMI